MNLVLVIVGDNEVVSLVGELDVHHGAPALLRAHDDRKTWRRVLFVGSESPLLYLALEDEEDSVDQPDRQVAPIRAEVEAGGLRSEVLGDQAALVVDVPEHERFIVAYGGQDSIERVEAGDDLLLLVAYLQRAVSARDGLEFDDVLRLVVFLELQFLDLHDLLLFRQQLAGVDLLLRCEISVEVHDALDDVATPHPTKDFDGTRALGALAVASVDVEALDSVGLDVLQVLDIDGLPEIDHLLELYARVPDFDEAVFSSGHHHAGLSIQAESIRHAYAIDGYPRVGLLGKDEVFRVAVGRYVSQIVSENHV